LTRLSGEYLRCIAGRHELIVPAPGAEGFDSLVVLTRQAFAAGPWAIHARLFNEFHALTLAVGNAHCGRRRNCDGCPLSVDHHAQ